MSDAISHAAPPSRQSLAGVLAGLIALGLGIVYFYFPFMRAGWPGVFHLAFWGFETFLLLWLLISLIWHRLPTRWVRLAPSFGRNRVFIPREGIGYLLIMGVLFVGSSLTHSNTLLLVFAAMAGPFVVNGSIAYTMLKHSRVMRRTPRRAMVGELFSVEVDLKNELPLMSIWMMIVQDRISFGAESWEPSVLFTRVAPRTVQTGHYQVRLMQRGRHQFGPVHVTTRFPLGLVERGTVLREAGEVLVYPRIGRLAPRWKRQLMGASELIETPQPRLGVFNDEYHHLREYRTGDNPRAIHWRSSAKKNALIVREFQQNREHHLLVLIDLWAPKSATATTREIVELSLSLAASLCCEHRSSCRGATLTVYGVGRETWHWETRAHESGLESLLDRLAVLEPTNEDNFGSTLVTATAGISSTTRVVAISSRPEASRTEPKNGNGTEIRTQRQSVQWIEVTPAKYRELLLFPENPSERTASPESRPQPSSPVLAAAEER